MSIREHIQKTTQQAMMYAKIADQLESIVPVVRTPADRSREPHQPPLLNDTDCDVKLPSMIVVEHLPIEEAEGVCKRLQDKLGEIASIYREVALNTLRGASVEEQGESNANTGD